MDIQQQQQEEDWFTHKINFDLYPVQNEVFLPSGKYYDTDILINVSDELLIEYHKKCWEECKQIYYFPIGTFNLSLASIFGSLQVLYEAYKENKSVLIFSIDGVLAKFIYESFYYMVTNTHLNNAVTINHFINKLRLFDIHTYENWLKICKDCLDKKEEFLGNLYDYTLRASNITIKYITYE